MKLIGLILLCLCVFTLAPCQGAGPSAPPTKDSILTLANGYIAAIAPTLTGTDFQTINALKFDLTTTQKQPVFFKPLIRDRVSQFTVLLGAQKSLPALTVACAYLVQYDPANPRTTNLLANVLAFQLKRDDAVTLLEYTLQLDPKSTLAMNNLANAYMNDNKDEMGRVLLEKVVSLDPKNIRAYQMLACYWYKKKDTGRTLDCLLKAAALNGVTFKKSKQNEETTEKNGPATGDTEDILKRKTEALDNLTPLSTADVIESDFPDVAQKIRDNVGKLKDNERMQLPELPEMSTSSLKNYVASARIYQAWADVVAKRGAAALKDIGLATATDMGISAGDSEQVKRQKGLEAAKKQMQGTLTNAQQMLEAMKNMPGMSPAKIARAEQSLQAAARKQGVQLTDSGSSDADAASPSPVSNLAGAVDTGGIFALRNFNDYLRAKAAYSLYLNTTFRNYNEKVAAINEAYNKLAKQENDDHDQIDKDIAAEEQRARNEQASGSARYNDGAFDDAPFKLKLKKELLRHIRKMNEYGENFYKQWVNLYMPQYAQKLKPRLEAFWYVNTLYIRNMNDPEIMKREYRYALQTYWTYAMQAVTGIGGGGAFPYSAESEAEAAQLEKEIQEAEAAIELRLRTSFTNQTKSASNSMPKWLEANLVLTVAIEFLTIKVTPRNIEFDAWIFGLDGKVTYNFQNNTITTSSAFKAKLELGMQIGPIDAMLKGEAKLLESTTTFNLNNGKVTEGSNGFLNGNLKAAAGGAEVGGKLQIDPALDNEVSGKVFYNAGPSYKYNPSGGQ